LPRRLGDDPLTRARNAKAATSVVTADASPQPDAPAPARSSRRSSYNDVFFQRRGETGTLQVESQSAPSAEQAEISEISEIPEMREVAAAPIAHPEVIVPQPAPAIAPVEVRPEPIAVTVEATVATAGPSMPVSAAPIAAPEAVSPPVAIADAPKPEAEKSGGFFKRIFGRFGK